ncbi:MAG: hypothetical protein ACRDO1_16210 [Nocardioidaceae bacterium]
MTEHAPDPIIVDSVQHVRDRFGARGLEDLIVLAQTELAAAKAALEELSDS